MGTPYAKYLPTSLPCSLELHYSHLILGILRFCFFCLQVLPIKLNTALRQSNEIDSLSLVIPCTASSEQDA